MANPRQEAYEKLAGTYEVRVLEPSPPAVSSPPFSDDPIRDGEVPDGRLLVSPVTGGDLSWDQIAGERPEIADWCAERWLGAWRRLEPLPESFGETRVALHKIAEEVVAPAREPENEIALRFTRCGFGTPFFEQDGRDCQVRVQHGHLVRQIGGDEDFADIDGVDKAAAHALGDFYGFACSVLEQLRAENATLDPSPVQLWPEHFDLAFELGSEAKAQRANYGASPGDEHHPAPYIYVGPWTAEVSGELWNGKGFNGAELDYDEIVAAPDQRALALEFMRLRLAAIEAR